MGRGLLIVFSILFFTSFSQVGPRVWQDHLGLSSCNTVTKLGSKIYASNGNGIIRADEQELSPEYLTKINGLNDVGVNLLRTNPYNNKLLAIYGNCNIDIIDVAGTIKNYADFKLKTLNGKKTINEVYFDKQLAYLACGFGIVVFDTDKLEIKDTYIIGPAGSNLEVYQTALNDSMIFAATPLGLYKANYKRKILNNFNNWKLDTISLPKGAYSGVVNVAGKILAGYSPLKLDASVQFKDTLYILNNTNTWAKYFSNQGQLNIHKLGYTNGELFSLIDQFGAKVINVNTNQLENYITTFNGNPNILIQDIYFGKDFSSNISYWCADFFFGLYHTYSYYPYYPQELLSRNGTHKTLINNIDVFDGKLAVSPSHVDNAGGSSYTREGINTYDNNEWSYSQGKTLSGGEIIDICHVLIDRKDRNHIWASSWFAGLLEYRHDSLLAVYNHSNSPLPEIEPGTQRCSGLAMDADGNLWISSSDSKNYLSVIRKNGLFQNFEFDNPRFIRKMMVDKNNYVWILHERDGGITVFKHDNFTNPQYKLLTKDVGNGALDNNSVYSIAEDKDGKIWVGTAEGIRVFYNSAGIFNATNFDAQPIKIVQDGNVELLLGKEVVTSIVIDGANNKWCGTESGGVYCFSPDGLIQLYHFTKETSPLNSNNVVEMNYNQVTGDIFIGTDLGIQSFRSTIVEGDDAYNNVVAYPNPVKPNYTGSVLVRGLVDKSIVKITDAGGNLVWETKSNGGQIEWPVTTLSGSRVTTGVYIVYASTTDGTQKALTKVLVVN